MQEGTCFVHSGFIVRETGSWIKSCEPVNLIHSTTTFLPQCNTLVPNAKALQKGN